MLRAAAGLFAMSATACFIKPEPPLARTDGGDGSDGSAGPCTLRDDFMAMEPERGAWAEASHPGGSVTIDRTTGHLRSNRSILPARVCASTSPGTPKS